MWFYLSEGSLPPIENFGRSKDVLLALYDPEESGWKYLTMGYLAKTFMGLVWIDQEGTCVENYFDEVFAWADIEFPEVPNVS